MAEPGMSIVVRVATRWMLGLALVFGLALALFGHVTPGGGFAGGVVLAGAFVLAALAYGGRSPPVAWLGRTAGALDSSGALAYLCIALLGSLLGQFFVNWIPRSASLFRLDSATQLVLINVAILLKVGAGLFAGFLAIVVFVRGTGTAEEGR